MVDPISVLGVCGSLRAASLNAMLLRTARRLAPPQVRFTVFASLGDLPLFNPDLEASMPAPVQRWHSAVATSNALLIASPEYAHGVSGSIKNALDWLVSFEPFVGKVVAVVNASPRAQHADMALRETLKTMSAVIAEHASISLPILGSGLTEEQMGDDVVMGRSIRNVLAELYDAVVASRAAENDSS
ncbi:MAG TPA: NADPH-dependent FMN reductase [Burkholderiaceae bacterium]|nr:NADPH-dependent FMN reductase [Burkholderiaceae bacterium]